MKSYNGFQGSVNWIRLRSLSEQPAATEKRLKNDLVIVRASFHMFLIYNQNFLKLKTLPLFLAFPFLEEKQTPCVSYCVLH